MSHSQLQNVRRSEDTLTNVALIEVVPNLEDKAGSQDPYTIYKDQSRLLRLKT
jgi:hypothetical protein